MQPHSDCSESFYKKELEADIRTNSTKNAEERRAMMEMLKRFEEEAVEDEEALLKADRDDDDEEEDLADKLGQVDLGEHLYSTVKSLNWLTGYQTRLRMTSFGQHLLRHSVRNSCLL